MITIAFLFAAWIVYKAVRRISSQYRHLDKEEIRDVMLNRTDKNSPEYSRIIRHLGICEKCQDKLHNYKNEDYIEDHLVD